MKILIHDCNFLGDTLMSSPIYKAFKDAGHEVHSLGSPYQRELLEGNPYIDKIWTPKNQWTIIPQLRAECFDYTMQLNTSLKTNLFLKILGAVSIGYSYKWKGFPLDIKIPIDRPTCTRGNRIEEIDDLIFSAFGLRLEPKMIFNTTWMAKPNGWTLIHPCSGRHKRKRMWDYRKWARLIDALRLKGHEICLIGSYADKPEIAKILGNCQSFLVEDKSGLFDVERLARCIGGAKLLITVNSFPLHLGISQGTPTVCLIGRTPKEVIVHNSVDKFWWVEDPAIHDKSLKPMNFSVEEVLEKVKEALSENN